MEGEDARSGAGEGGGVGECMRERTGDVLMSSSAACVA